MEKVFTESKLKTPEEKIWIGIIQQAFEDAFEIGIGHNLSMGEIQRARNWFYTKACSDACDHAGTTRDHIQKLYNKLSDRYKSGHITKDELRFAIRKLELKI
tara:strand:- start:184 stop:489 length:306 start_codon:yes stop_codon:yes gene_type:complete